MTEEEYNGVKEFAKAENEFRESLHREPTKEEAIEVLQAARKMTLRGTAYEYDFVDRSFDMAIEALTHTEPVHGEWIPVSERLPEPSYELLLVSGYIKTGDLKTFATDIARWNGDNWTFEGKPMPDVPILAWMPMPEPYREVGQ